MSTTNYQRSRIERIVLKRGVENPTCEACQRAIHGARAFGADGYGPVHPNCLDVDAGGQR